MRFNYLLSKTEAAFIHSALSFEQCKRAYFWTFTWPVKMSDWRYSPSWKRFSERLMNRVSYDFRAVGVWQPHETGGLHVHAIVNERVSKDMVDRLALSCGMGITDVRRAWDIAGAAGYLARYLTRPDQKVFKRAWFKLGDWQHTRVSDVMVESPDADLFRKAYAFARAELPTGRPQEVFSRARFYAQNLQRVNEHASL